MNLFEMLSTAQNGRAMANLGAQFGLDEAQTADAVRQLLPAFSTGLKRNTATPDGIGSLLQALNDGRHERYYDDDGIFADTSVRDDGNGILGHVLGSKDVSRAVADRAAEHTGIGSDILKQMLPYVASMVMGALFKGGQNPLGSVLGQILGGAQAGPGSGDNPFGSLAEVLAGGGRSASPADVPQTGADIFGSMFDADGDGSVMDDIFDAVLSGKR